MILVLDAVDDNDIDVETFSNHDENEIYEDYEDDGIASDIGENEPGMVPSRGPNCQVSFKHMFINYDLINLKSFV